ncbi:MAG: ABC transporter permease subunit, partial [Acidobacteriota bacterium]
MIRPRLVYHMVRADFLERTRRPSFLITLGFSVYLGYLVNSGLVSLQLDHWRGLPNSAWNGAVIALVGSVFLPLVGFYIVKNTIQRDRETRVGRILAATPMSRTFYTVSKALSNFAVLASMVVVLAIAAIILQWTHPGTGPTSYTDLLTPLFVFALSSLSITAALAVLFETLPGLRGGLGNVLYFFLWIFLISLSVTSLTGNHALSPSSYLHDYTGIATISGNMQAQVRLLDPTYAGGSS